METCNIIIFSLFTGGVLSSHSAIRWKDEKSAQKALFLGGNPCCCYGKITLDDNSFKNRTIGKFALSSMRGVPVKDSYLVQVHIFFSYIIFFYLGSYSKSMNDKTFISFLRPRHIPLK